MTAFGRQYAYKVTYSNVVLRTDGPVAWPVDLDPQDLLRGLAALSGCGLVLVAVISARRRGRLREPAYAGLATFLAILVAVPPSAWSGGGYPVGYPTFRRWMFGDQVGTVNVIVNESGVQVARRVFTPFGQSLGGTDTGEHVSEMFAGHREEHYLAIANMGARWYDMVSGRFMSIDPQVSDLDNPQTHNPYGYVENNPVNRVDPTGQASISIGGVRISVGGLGLPNSTIGNGGILGCGFAGCSGGAVSLPLPTINGISGPISSPVGSAGGVTQGLGFNNAECPSCHSGNPYQRPDRPSDPNVHSPYRLIFDYERPLGGSYLLEAGTLIPGGKLLKWASGGIRFAQRAISATFRHGEFAGKTIQEVATGLRSGAIVADQLPIQTITREGVTYTLNNRSLMALRQAGLEPTIVRDVTGNSFFEGELTRRLKELGGAAAPDFVPLIRGGP